MSDVAIPVGFRDGDRSKPLTDTLRLAEALAAVVVQSGLAEEQGLSALNIAKELIDLRARGPLDLSTAS